MSFILDALKKSEAERQQQAGGEFANVPTSSGEKQSFRWLWILALLLLVNVAVLLGILMRDDVPDSVPVPIDKLEPSPESAAEAQPSFEQQIAAARQNQPRTAEPPPAVAQPARPSAINRAPEPAPVSRNVPTFDELRVNGTLQLTDLHLDIHVFAENPADRFVFINMNKQRENTQLEEGPVVREITADGVILEHQGATFLLPRE